MVLFWTFWVVDLLIWLVCAYETFMVSSNSSLLIPLILMSACLGISWWLKASSLKWALIVAGIPAGLLALFVVGWILALIFGKGNFQ